MARPTVVGLRTPSGQLSRAKQDVPLTLLRSMAALGKISGLYTTYFGMLSVSGEISERQYQAGLKFARQRAAADRARGISRVKAQDLNRTFSHNDSIETPDTIQDGKVAIRRWENAVAATGGYSSAPYKALEWIVLDLRVSDGRQQTLDLKAGLTSLVHHYSSRGE
jgi:hypothetical protein